MLSYHSDTGWRWATGL